MIATQFHRRVVAARFDIEAQQGLGVGSAQVEAPVAKIHAETVDSIDFVRQFGVVSLDALYYRPRILDRDIDFPADGKPLDALVYQFGQRFTLD